MNEFNGFCHKQFLEDCLKLPVSSNDSNSIGLNQELPKPKYNLWSNVWIQWDNEDEDENFNRNPLRYQGTITGIVWSPKNWLIPSTFIYTVCFKDGYQDEFPEYEILE